MKSLRKICFVSGSRAEYGLLKPLVKRVQNASDCAVQLVVTGMHLSPEFGLTYRTVEEDGLRIDRKVEMLLSSDSPVGIAKSIGLATIGFAEVWEELRPDIIVVLGDRFEIFAAVSAAVVHRIPVAHIHGGEVTLGAIDDCFRHAITKMAHLHFTATKDYRRRVIQLGEDPARVFHCGAIGVDRILAMKLLDRGGFEQQTGVRLAARNLLVTYHPVTLESATATEQFRLILDAIDKVDANIIFTKPNADTDGRIIGDMIDAYVDKHPKTTKAFASMGDLWYLSALRLVDGVVGNSSSGIIEAPSLQTGTVNIGDRQKGRCMANSILNCSPDPASLKAALDTLFSDDYRRRLAVVKNPYGQGGATACIFDRLRDYPLTDILKKGFHDLHEKETSV